MKIIRHVSIHTISEISFTKHMNSYRQYRKGGIWESEKRSPFGKHNKRVIPTEGWEALGDRFAGLDLMMKDVYHKRTPLTPSPPVQEASTWQTTVFLELGENKGNANMLKTHNMSKFLICGACQAGGSMEPR